MGLFPKRDLVRALCGQRWLITRQKGDEYEIRNMDSRRRYDIDVRAGNGRSVSFQLFFHLRFSLEKTPQGLFAKAMMRSHDLTYPSWQMHLDQSCEAQLYLAARVPKAALDPSLFDFICEEMRAEADGFDRELREKFAYGRPVEAPSPRDSNSSGHAIVRLPRNDNLPRRDPWS